MRARERERYKLCAMDGWNLEDQRLQATKVQNGFGGKTIYHFGLVTSFYFDKKMRNGMFNIVAVGIVGIHSFENDNFIANLILVGFFRHCLEDELHQKFCFFANFWIRF